MLHRCSACSRTKQQVPYLELVIAKTLLKVCCVPVLLSLPGILQARDDCRYSWLLVQLDELLMGDFLQTAESVCMQADCKRGHASGRMPLHALSRLYSCCAGLEMQCMHCDLMQLNACCVTPGIPQHIMSGPGIVKSHSSIDLCVESHAGRL